MTFITQRGLKKTAFLAGTAAMLSSRAASAQSARIVATPSNPVTISIGGQNLLPVDGFGPIYSVAGKDIEPSQYQVQIVKREAVPKGFRLTCRATAPGLSATYFLTVTQPKIGRIDLALSGDDAVSGASPGKLLGAGDSVKQFYTGEREAEPYEPGKTSSHVIYISTEPGETSSHAVYIPSAKLFMRGAWNLDASHAARSRLTVPVASNFTAKAPPLASEMVYEGGIIDGKPAPVPKLNERFILTYSKKLWDIYPPLPQKPSAYRAEMSKQVYIDLWDYHPVLEENFLKWLRDATKGQVPFLTIVQDWGERGFDGTLPDLFRIPDHMKQKNSTLEELKSLVDTAKTMGRAGLRTNYELITPYSWSLKEGTVRAQKKIAGNDGPYTDFPTKFPLIERQENDIKSYFHDTARFSDQISSPGDGWEHVQYELNYPGRATIAGVRASLRQQAALIKKKVNGPLLSETMNSDFLTGQYVDSADFGIFAGHRRHDFSPEWKLRHFNPLTVTHSMGLGYRFFADPREENWVGKGFEMFWGDPKNYDDYRACEVLYGNGGYIFWYPIYQKSRALTEVLTVGVAQPYYTMAPLDYVEYGKAGQWKQLPQIVEAASTRDEMFSWYQQFHVRYKNGCNVWVNRKDENMSVKLPNGKLLTLPQYGYVVYTEDGNLLTYCALADSTSPTDNKQRIDFCEDKKRGLKYVNPRNPSVPIQGVTIPTFWVNGKKVYELTQDGPSAVE